GYKVEMTRAGDTGLTLEERVEFANRFPNAVFVSIHFNSGTGGAGVESYALAPAGAPTNAAEGGEQHAAVTDAGPDDGNAQDSQNIALTAAVHAAVLSRTGAFDRGIRHARFKVLRNIRIPALLLEGGFVNDPAEGQKIASLQYRQQLGLAIAQGVQSYNAAVNYRAATTNFAVVSAALPPHTRSITEPLRSDSPPTLAPPEAPSITINVGEQ
ncbi:MAG: N-acetylmuramoyl-L-alanine amidase, partial [Verrucomicrobiota bacterium]|nr:N-acetylmuramoyl-L-alanine amidase [Verrucomicrobiota bacterium]